MIFRHIDDMEGVIVGGVNINNLRYADDTVLLADREGSLQTILNEVNEAGKAFNMKMNAKKTKTMITRKLHLQANVTKKVIILHNPSYRL